MVSILRRAIALVALAVGVGVAAGAVPAAAATTHHTTTTHQTVRHAPTGGTVYAQPSDWWF
jgi:ABC-type sugar transport system substrate-binding protein